MQINNDPQSKYESAIIQELQRELDEKVKKMIELNQTVDVLKSESELAPEIFQKIIDTISSKKILESTKGE